MEIYNLPIYIDKSMYSNAIDKFIENSSEYIESLYTVGNISYPGLSDIDLVVVPKNKYIAPLKLEMREIVPKCYKNIVQHNPFIIPEPIKEVFKYASLSNIELYYGRDSLQNIEADNSYTNKLCTCIEGLMAQINTLNNIRDIQKIDATPSIAMFSGLRFNIELLNELKITDNMNYGLEFDQLREDFMKTKSKLLVLEMYELFQDKLIEVTEILMNDLEIDVGEVSSIKEFYMNSNRKCKDFDTDLAQRRKDKIQEYLFFLAENNYYYGSAFRKELYSKKPIKFSYRLFMKIYNVIT